MRIKNVFQKPFKKQVLILFMPVIIASLIIIGLFAYGFETMNIQRNANSLIKSTVQQASTLLDDKMMTLFSQMVNLSNSTEVNNLMLYDDTDSNNTNGYNDILGSYNSMAEIYRNYDQIVDSLYFCNNKGTEVKYFARDVPSHIGLSLSEWMEKYNDSSQGIYWLNSHENDVLKTTDPHNVISVFRIIGTRDSKSSGIMLLNLNSNYFINILNNIKVTEHGYMMIISKDGTMQSTTANNQYVLPLEEIQKLRDNLGSNNGSMNLRSVTNQNMIVTYHSIPVNGWMVAAVVPQSDLLSQGGGFSIILLVLLAVLIMVVTFLSNLLAKSISKPIVYLSDQVIRFDNGDMDVDFHVDTENEIGVLSHGLSYLKQAVTELLTQVCKEQEQKAKMQLLAMQEQIKPHFLYNTIGSIKHLVDMNENVMASKMCGSLARFYRLGISGGKAIVTLEEEVDHVRNYLQIQKMRYGTDFEYVINFDENILNTEVLKLILQPLVENAIYHGIKTKEGVGTIIISGEKTDENVFLRVYDDGEGMDQVQLDDLRHSLTMPREENHMKNFGVRNVNLRLKLHFGPGAGLEFDSVKNVYTQATIVIPVKKADGGEKFDA